MKPKDQRIAIAKACGWKLKWQNEGGGDLFDSKPKGHSWEFWTPPPKWYQTVEGRAFYNDPESWSLQPPDYLNDLNAMHEAEKNLNQNQSVLYCVRLMHPSAEQSIYATAAQRAEAFLKTLNLWKE